MKWPRLLVALPLLAACERQITTPEQTPFESDLMEVGPLTTDLLQPGPRVPTLERDGLMSATAAPVMTTGPNPDLLWRRSVSGENTVWRMKDTTYTGSAIGLPSAATAWEVGGVADFNRDRRPDILWRRASTSSNVIWILNGAGGVADIVALPTSAPEWKMAGAGDFNRDGSPDILWRRPSTSSVVLWMMNGATLTDIVALPALDSTWSVGGIADMTGDGFPDILTRKVSTGTNVLWRMNGVQKAEEITLAPLAWPWILAGAGDFTDDGKADLVWRHPTSRKSVIWVMNGTTYTGVYTYLPEVHPEWSIVGVADFDPPPPVPSSVTATAVSGSRVDLAWADSSALETEFRVEVRAGSSTTWTLLATLPANTTTFSHTNTVVNVQYSYRVIACDGSACSAPSAIVSATPGQSAPTADTGIVTALGTTTTVSGSAVPNGLPTVGWLELDDNAGFTSPASSDTASLGSASAPKGIERSFSGLTVGGTYYFRMVARNSAGTTYGSARSFVVAAPPAPVGLNATFITSSLANSVDWTFPDNYGISYSVDGFRIERRRSDETTWTTRDWREPAFCGSAGNGHCGDYDINVRTPTTYVYRVQLCNGVGCGPWAETSVTTQVFAAPTNLVATAGAGKVTLTWQDNTSSEDSYRISRRSEADSVWHSINEVDPNVTTVTDNSVTPGVRYEYRVEAFASSGTMSSGFKYQYSDYSNVATAVPY
ncbi:FG-GAP-like repeat-containing protein [Longimicrobium terrae]|uniref:Fibronectin type-III domain-containing protein n=1 Tax=Longimicrobium terrae TaxID=1639882 RepID=A0A841H5V0_9BACT|nr:FG-GAP-like repeat-containing protein [Longimicrobium terrae]MBB4639271.1 hypothetical protein [Longimicrobium terrae]MBB6073511.1 hypothetical protein [Longimicrobium terrae]NNC32239.1 hypothetical protein [Longimicrobium terrae]